MCVSCNLSVSKSVLLLLSACYYDRLYPDRILYQRIMVDACICAGQFPDQPVCALAAVIGPTRECSMQA